MNCSDARPLLDLLCDGALEPKDSALLLDHLKTCNECQYEWNSLEELHSRFSEEKNRFPMPAGVMDRISEKLSDEERNQHKLRFERFVRGVPILALTASLALIGYPFLSWYQHLETKSNSMQTASADSLIENLEREEATESVKDRNELVKRLGYELKYVRLPDWRMNRSAMYKSKSTVPIARFDFVKTDKEGTHLLSCYQSPQGVIRTDAARLESLEGKRALIGTHGKFNFALWSQDGRDYLFVTELSKLQLEEIVRRA